MVFEFEAFKLSIYINKSDFSPYVNKARPNTVRHVASHVTYCLSTLTLPMERYDLKNANNCLHSNIYSYLGTSGDQSSSLYLNVAHFFQRLC